MELFFLLQIGFHIVGALIGFALGKSEEAANRLTHGFAILAGLSGVYYSLNILLGFGSLSLEFPSGLPFGLVTFGADSLSAFFVLVLSFLSVAASLFAIGYTREYQGKRSIAVLGLFYHVFLASMVLVLTAKNAFYFLVVWELMSLGSYFLVIFEHEKPEARRAGLIYFIMTHAGTAFIAAAFWLLASASGSFSFDVFHEHAGLLSPILKNAIFFSAFIGFGTKAGMMPFHIWLPEAHPEAPSHVSALMSGVMIKTAIYGLLRFLFEFLGPAPMGWGVAILFFGAVSTLLGILYALMEHDLKRLLAFSSIENIGIILLGIGMTLVFASTGNNLLAAFSLAAALFHVLNHAAFKGLLFLAAGSVLSRTHTRNMEALGGLIKRMPWTAASFLVGAVAISALPPLNGFVSEWMTFLALLLGIQVDLLPVRFFAPVLAAVLGLAGALAATCFVKAFAITFLGSPRSHQAEEAERASFSMKLATAILAASCVGFAAAAPWIVRWIGNVTRLTLGEEIDFSKIASGNYLVIPEGFSRFSPVYVFLIVTAVIGTVSAVVWILTRKLPVRIGPSWDCGLPQLTARMQYTATGYSKPIRRIFSFLYQPTRKVEVEDEGHEILRTAERFETGVRPLFEEIFYRPVYKLVLFISERVRRIQTGHIQLYLSYIFATLILLLIFARLS